MGNCGSGLTKITPEEITIKKPQNRGIRDKRSKNSCDLKDSRKFVDSLRQNYVSQTRREINKNQSELLHIELETESLNREEIGDFINLDLIQKIREMAKEEIKNIVRDEVRRIIKFENKQLLNKIYEHKSSEQKESEHVSRLEQCVNDLNLK